MGSERPLNGFNLCSSAKTGFMSSAKASTSKACPGTPSSGIRCKACAKPSQNCLTSGLDPAKAEACINKVPLRGAGKRPQQPKSIKATRSQAPVSPGTAIMLPQCRSAWKMAVPSITDRAATESAEVSDFCHCSGASHWGLAQMSLKGTPSIRSMVSTRDAEASEKVRGTRTVSCKRARRSVTEVSSQFLKSSIFCLSTDRSHSAITAVRSSSTQAVREALTNWRTTSSPRTKSAKRANSVAAAKSTLKRSRTRGRKTFTTQCSPERRRAA
mmetsp:Transcript_24067/g.52402  ORF Transcript_24067/g.52402 Transcript_24067/m.52402 type:complete len:271 (+) Transcript_24067:491-1303(+)